MSFFHDQGEPHDQQVSQGRGHGGYGAVGHGGRGGRGRGNGGERGQGQRSEHGSNFYQALSNNNNYHCHEPGQIEDNSKEQSVSCSHCIESHVLYPPSNYLTPNPQSVGSCLTVACC